MLGLFEDVTANLSVPLIVWLEFFDPANWPAALGGVGSLLPLFPLPSNTPGLAGILPFLDAAEGQAVGTCCHVSVFGADRAWFLPHYKVEQRPFASSMSWTVLRAVQLLHANLHRTMTWRLSATRRTTPTGMVALFAPSRCVRYTPLLSLPA